MIKQKLNSSKGVSLITLSIAIIVLVVLTNVIIYNVKDSLGVEKLKSMQNDIENLRDKVASYYAQNGKLPASIKYNNIQNIKDAGVISEATDTGDFYIIDLSAIDNLTLTYGEDFKNITPDLLEEDINKYKDLYIINGTSHNIFYVQGITLDNETFYTTYTSKDIDKASVDLRYVENVKIPDGFYYVGGTKDTGIVISDEKGDDLNNTKQGNQFVWIPVDNNNFDKVFKRTEGYWNGSLASMMANSGEAGADGNNSYLQQNSLDESETTKKEAKQMYESVEKYGGFYIGRFEAGKGENESTISKKKAQVYTGIAWSSLDTMNTDTGGAVEKARGFSSSKGYTSVTSTLCYGVQWDATLNFIDPNYITNEVNGKPNCIENSYVRNSTGKGNYNEAENNNEWKGLPTLTGNSEEYKVNNIYDLAGNVWEWTMESNGTEYRVRRGGSCYRTGIDYPSSSRFLSIQSNKVSDGGFRVSLYLNIEDDWSMEYDKSGNYTDKNSDSVYIPKGFQVSQNVGENTIEDGLVIKNATTGDRYVWVEVPKSIYTTALSDTDYDKIEADLKTYTAEYKSDYTDRWYAIDGDKAITEDIENLTQVQKNLNNGCGLNYDEYINLRQQMYTSIYNNGGFWISQYEIGTETARDNSSLQLTTPVSKEGAYPYNYVTCSQAQKLANDINAGDKTSSLLFGIQWDLVCKFLEKNGDLKKEEISTNSGKYGNYKGSQFYMIRGKYTSSPNNMKSWIDINSNTMKKATEMLLLSCGATDSSSLINIYDLAGNLGEYTLEKSNNNDSNLTVHRGGSLYNESSSINSRVIYSNTYLSESLGFRVALY